MSHGTDGKSKNYTNFKHFRIINLVIRKNGLTTFITEIDRITENKNRNIRNENDNEICHTHADNPKCINIH